MAGSPPAATPVVSVSLTASPADGIIDEVTAIDAARRDAIGMPGDARRPIVRVEKRSAAVEPPARRAAPAVEPPAGMVMAFGDAGLLAADDGRATGG